MMLTYLGAVCARYVAVLTNGYSSLGNAATGRDLSRGSLIHYFFHCVMQGIKSFDVK